MWHSDAIQTINQSPITAKPAFFKGGSGKFTQLAKPCKLTATGNQVMLDTKYNPSGTGWLALGATFITVIIVTAVAQATGFAAGPGLLVWYVIIQAIRRKKAQFDLTQAKDIVVDKKKRGMSALLSLGEKDTWIGIRFNKNQMQWLESLLSSQVIKYREGKLKNPQSTAIIVFLAIILLFILSLIIIVNVFN